MSAQSGGAHNDQQLLKAALTTPQTSGVKPLRLLAKKSETPPESTLGPYVMAVLPWLVGPDIALVLAVVHRSALIGGALEEQVHFSSINNHREECDGSRDQNE